MQTREQAALEVYNIIGTYNKASAESAQAIVKELYNDFESTRNRKCMKVIKSK